MEDHEKTREQLLEELSHMRHRVATLEAVGKLPEDTAGTEENLVLWRENNRRAFAGEKVEEEVTLTIKDEKRDCHNVIAPIRIDGEIQGILGVNVDITEQKRAEQTLRESEERFRKVFEEGPISVALVSTDGRIHHCNRRFCEMLGYSEDEIVALGLPGISHPDDWERDYPFFSRLWNGEIPYYHVNKRYLCKDGQVIWGQLTVSLMHDEAGRPINTIGMVEDITERKRAEEALRNSERTLRTLIDASPETILLLDTEGTVLIANETVAHRLGTTVAEMVGHKVHDFLSAEVAANRMRCCEEVVRTGKPIRFEDKRLERYFANVMCPVIDEGGKVIAVAALGIDQTERKRAEQALKQAHDELEQRVEERTAELTKANEELTKFRRFVDASRQGLAMVTLNGEMTYVNPAISRLLADGRSEDVIGKHVSTYCSEEYMHQREQEVLPSLLREGHWEGEVAIPLRSGPIIVLQNSFLVRDEQGNPAYLATVLTDITERKHAEEALRREHRTIKHLLQSSDHERQTIAYEIHDGLAQQLAGAIMQFQTYAHQRDRNPRLATKAYDAGMTMLQQGHSEARRLISGVRPPILDESGVATAVAHFVNEERHQKGPHIELHSEVGFDRLAPILENAIYRIVQEALTNACTHSKSERVRVELVQHGDDLRIRIQDWGVGFDPADFEENRFGLAGIRERARLLGGSTTVESTPGQGTCITVELPLVMRE